MLDLSQYAGLLIYVALGCSFIGGIFVVSFFCRDRGNDPFGKGIYECGMPTIGSPYVSPNIRFYIFALLFVIFDIETIFILPWAVKFKELGLVGFVEMVIFLFVLLVGFAYAWRKGALKWQ